ncbi:MAG: ribosome small subunit-dependent GTPase A, partial [Muribaculaceae bacterium]|nr:ribosome small subunit-dependent GTPase A [Muribaculaceae bacterium]
MEGLVIKNAGNLYNVLTKDRHTIQCRIKGKFRLKGIRTTNPIAVGDRVIVSDAPAPDGTSYITAIVPRENYIIRRASNLSKESHIIAANIDRAMLVLTLAHPTTSTTFVDRFLATAEAYRVNATLVINKTDLLQTEEDREFLEAFSYLYKSIGYDVMHVSARTGKGINLLRQQLEGKITLFSGNSGVGKSTLINDLIPGLNLKTSAISDVHDSGMHTTTFSEMFFLESGNPDSGAVIDTPGIRGFGTIDFDKNDTGHFFPEIFRESARCRFNNCTHIHEPGCAVREALDNHVIAQSRYTSY